MSSKIEDEAPRSKRRRRNRRARHKPQQSLAGRLTYEVSESDPRLFEVGLETSVQEGTISFHHGGRWLANMLVGPMASVSADGVLTLGSDCGINAEALRVVVSYMYTGSCWPLRRSTCSLRRTSWSSTRQRACACRSCATASARRPRRARWQQVRTTAAPSSRMALAASWPSTFEQVSALDDYRTLLPAVMWSLVRLDTLCISSEIVVIEAVARWADNDAPNREATYYTRRCSRTRTPCACLSSLLTSSRRCTPRQGLDTRALSMSESALSSFVVFLAVRTYPALGGTRRRSQSFRRCRPRWSARHRPDCVRGGQDDLWSR